MVNNPLIMHYFLGAVWALRGCPLDSHDVGTRGVSFRLGETLRLRMLVNQFSNSRLRCWDEN